MQSPKIVQAKEPKLKITVCNLHCFIDK